MIVVDTSAWSLVLRRRDGHGGETKIANFLRRLIEEGQLMGVPGIVYQELLSGVSDLSQKKNIRETIGAFPLLLATKDDHAEAARIFTECRKGGAQASTIDCLIAAQCITSDSTLLTADTDFRRIAKYSSLKLLFTV